MKKSVVAICLVLIGFVGGWYSSALFGKYWANRLQLSINLERLVFSASCSKCVRSGESERLDSLLVGSNEHSLGRVEHALNNGATRNPDRLPKLITQLSSAAEQAEILGRPDLTQRLAATHHSQKEQKGRA